MLVQTKNVYLYESSKMPRDDLEEASTRNAGRESVGVEVLLDALRQGELNLAIVELLQVGSTALVGLDLFDSDDLDRVGTSTVTSAHISV